MKIIFDLPDWAIGSHISIVAKGKLLGYARFAKKKEYVNGKLVITKYYEPVKIKPDNGHCNGCGDCCNSGSPFIREEWEQIKEIVNTKENKSGKPCPFITPDGCFLARFNDTPLSCIISDCSISFENCSEIFIPVSDIQLISEEER
jgi:hypothetical protein